MRYSPHPYLLLPLTASCYQTVDEITHSKVSTISQMKALVEMCSNHMLYLPTESLHVTHAISVLRHCNIARFYNSLIEAGAVYSRSLLSSASHNKGLLENRVLDRPGVWSLKHCCGRGRGSFGYINLWVKMIPLAMKAQLIKKYR